MPCTVAALPDPQTWLPCLFGIHIPGRKGSSWSPCSLAAGQVCGMVFLVSHRAGVNPGFEAQLCHCPAETLVRSCPSGSWCSHQSRGAAVFGPVIAPTSGWEDIEGTHPQPQHGLPPCSVLPVGWAGLMDTTTTTARCFLTSPVSYGSVSSGVGTQWEGLASELCPHGHVSPWV